MHSNAARASVARVSGEEHLAKKIDLAAIAAKEMWSHREMVLLGYATDRATTRRRVARGYFPKPVILSANSIAWIADEVRASVANRPRGFAPQPQRQRTSKGAVTLPEVGSSRGAT